MDGRTDGRKGGRKDQGLCSTHELIYYVTKHTKRVAQLNSLHLNVILKNYSYKYKVKYVFYHL